MTNGCLGPHSNRERPVRRITSVSTGSRPCANAGARARRRLAPSLGFVRSVDPLNTSRADALRHHRCHQLSGAENSDRALHVIGQDLQTHLGSHSRQRLGEEVRRAHPELQRAEYVLNGLSAQAWCLWCAVQPLLNYLEHVLVLPTRNASIVAGCALGLDRATWACRRPVPVQRLAAFLGGEPVDRELSSRTAVFIAACVIDEVPLVEAPVSNASRGQWLRHKRSDASTFALENFVAFVVTAIGQGNQALLPRGRLGTLGNICQVGHDRGQHW